MNGKIMNTGNLENIVGRLIYCSAVLDALRLAMDDDMMADAVAGAHDLLSSICKDFRKDIDTAKEVPA